MITASIFVFGFLMLVLYAILKRPNKVGKNGLPYPPSLPYLPIIGSALYKNKIQEMPFYFTKNFDRYGPIVGFYIGNKYNIMLNGKKAMYEAFVKKSSDFASRSPKFLNNDLVNPNGLGIMFHPYNEHFKKHHHLSLTIMKEFGFGSRIMENHILIEVEQLLENFSMLKGEAFYPVTYFANYALNILNRILFGKRFSDDDPTLAKMIQLIRETFETWGKLFFVNNFEFFIYLPYFKNILKRDLSLQNQILEIVEKKIKLAIDPDFSRLHPNFVNRYIELDRPNCDKLQLMHFLHQIFLAGTDTTNSSLCWTMALLATHPSLQDRMRSEIRQSVPNKRLPTSDDRPNLILVDAFIHELLRFKTNAPVTIPHETTKDTEVLGYFVPAKTFVIGNIYCAHFDPKIWGDPEVFRPERFIKDGQLVNKDLIVPFSLGKRSCFGEIMAKQEIFLSVCGLVQRFKILPPEGQTTIEVTDCYDVTVKPSPFKVRLIDADE